MTAINLANSEIERIMCTQSESFMKDKLSKQHWDNLQDSDKIIAPTLFNQYAWKTEKHPWQRRFCLCHVHGLIKGLWHNELDLFIAKLGAYGFQKDEFSFMKSYLTKRRQRLRVNTNFSTCKIMISGVPQYLILGPLFLNIFLIDLFLFVENSGLSNYADDTPYIVVIRTWKE